MNGVIEPQFEVHCEICGHPQLGLGKTMRAAVKELAFLKWKKVLGRWRCEGCADISSVGNSA